MDDSDDNGITFKMLNNLAKKDHRIQVFKPGEHSGIIGKIKNWACSLGKGHILVELDHDDELTDYALDYVVKGFKQFPEAGFLYTDCAEIFENGTNFTYREEQMKTAKSVCELIREAKIGIEFPMVVRADRVKIW